MQGDGAAGAPDKIRRMGADHQRGFFSLRHIPTFVEPRQYPAGLARQSTGDCEAEA